MPKNKSIEPMTLDGLSAIKFDLIIDFEANDALGWAPSDPESAAKALKIAANYMANGKPLPMGLREWLVDAINITVLKPKEFRAKTLATELYLTKGAGSRPSAYWLDVGEQVSDLIQLNGRSQTSACEEVAGNYSIDASTAKNYYKEYLGAVEAHRKINDEEMTR